ncbi:carbon storage regulator CsrA [Paenibacillus thalictri]|uniref:Translational regulator CsrA n=1 Tax=Paenibacillus thalictri TaxID=2527873 RepID=A0A4Q9DMH7_9BACL|nr:carbon storage regulator CsrA [Paenibacillus thalictri]TBL72996.1 carbon storage regulator [Paenibacillus thalictri]
MLVLSRKKGESIVINGNIELVVVSVEGDQVRLGIKAPKDVDIFRKEVFLSIQQSNQEASESAMFPDDLIKIFRNPEKN